MKSKLSFEILGKIWNMADVDKDGFLDEDEFAVAMHLCHKCMSGDALPDRLDPLLIPPSKRAALEAGC
jgi:hypothetical protein